MALDLVLKYHSFILFFLLFSCGEEMRKYEENVCFYTDFPYEKELYGEVIELDTALLRYPFRIRVAENKVIIMDLHGVDHYGHLFQYPDFRYLSSFGKRGESPAEMLSVENVRFYNYNIWTLDANKNELNQFEFSPSGDSLLLNDVAVLDGEILRALDFAIYNDTTLIIPDYSGDNRLCWTHCNGKMLKKTGNIPSANRKALQNARPALAQAWRSFVDYNPHNNILAMVTQLGEVLEIYNLKDSTYIVRIGAHGEPGFRLLKGYGIPTGIMGFSDIQVADSAIYTVFHGISFKEIEEYNGYIPHGGKYIYVFSLKGELLCKYILDHNVHGIWVDEVTKTIIATDVNNDQPIVKFTFS